MLGYVLLLLIPLAVIGFSGGSDNDDEEGEVDPAPGVGLIREGSAGADTQSGGPLGDLLFGRAGDDQLNGADGDDALVGEAGDDTLFGGEDDDLLIGGAGDDDLIGGSGEGFDILLGNDGDDSLRGDFGDDSLYGGGGADTLDGGVGDDRLVGWEPGVALADEVARLATPDAVRGILQAQFGSTISDGQISRVQEGFAGGTDELDAFDQIIGAAGFDLLLGDDGDVMAGGQNEDAFAVYVSSLTDAAVTITDYAPTLEEIEIVVADGLALGAVTAVARGTGSVLVMSGVDIVLLPNVATANVNLGLVSVNRL